MLTSFLHNKQCYFSHLAVGNDEAQTGKVVCPLPYRVSKPPALDSCCSLCLECSALSSGSLAPLGMSYVPYFSWTTPMSSKAQLWLATQHPSLRIDAPLGSASLWACLHKHLLQVYQVSLQWAHRWSVSPSSQVALGHLYIFRESLSPSQRLISVESKNK